MHASAMSLQESLGVKYIDAKYSSGDSNDMISKQYQEENNNEVDELSKELSEMGCIVGATKRPPNICVETCVYESEDDSSNHDEDGYSDEFEEDKSEEENEEEPSLKLGSRSLNSEMSGVAMCTKNQLKLCKSQSNVSSKTAGSISGRSTSNGSLFVPTTRRINMSFTNDRLREIERHNHILLSKILTARNAKKSTIPANEQPPWRPVPTAAVFRRKEQRKIDHDNMILLKKIQRVKSSACSIRR